MVESSIIDGIENKDLVTAAAGLVGVIVGGFITAIGQKAARNEERRQKILDRVAEMCAAAFDFLSTVNSLHQLPEEAPKSVAEEHTRIINLARDKVVNGGNALSVVAKGPVKWTSVEVANAVMRAGDYLHIAAGAGIADGFARKDEYLERIDRARNTLIDVSGQPKAVALLIFLIKRRKAVAENRGPKAVT